MGPNALDYSERVLAIVRAGGVPDRLAVLGQHLLIAAINGFTLDETAEVQPGQESGPADEPGNMASNYPSSLPPDRSPTSSTWPSTSRSPTRTSASSCCSTCLLTASRSVLRGSSPRRSGRSGRRPGQIAGLRLQVPLLRNACRASPGG